MLLGLLFPASLALHLDQTRNVGTATESAILEDVAGAIERRTKRAPRIDDVVWAERCGGGSACIAAIQARTGSSEVVILTIVGGVTKLRIIAAFIGERAAREAQVDMPLTRATWPAELDRLVEALGLAAGEEPISKPNVVASAREKIWWPYVVAGSGIVLAAIGVGFGISSQAASDRLAGAPARGEEYLGLLQRSEDHAIAANVLYASASIAVVTGLILFLVFD